MFGEGGLYLYVRRIVVSPPPAFKVIIHCNWVKVHRIIDEVRMDTQSTVAMAHLESVKLRMQSLELRTQYHQSI